MFVKILSYVFFLLIVTAYLSSCTNRNSHWEQETEVSKRTGVSPPAYVQKAWDAKYVYDEEKRLLIPKYAGSKWGSIKEYREDGQLAYQDWWVRDVKVEDLEASPETHMSNLIDTEPPQSINDGQAATEGVEEVSSGSPSKPEEQIEPVEDFVPSPFSPF